MGHNLKNKRNKTMSNWENVASLNEQGGEVAVVGIRVSGAECERINPNAHTCRDIP